MRKILIAGGAAFLILALAQAGYGDAGEASVQASGDITLNFGLEMEWDFELRDNYDLDNGLTDGCPRAAVTGEDCSGSRTNADGFVQQETRLLVEGSQGDVWKARVILHADELWEPEQAAIGLERAWADVKLFDTPVHVQVGKWSDGLEPFGWVYTSDDDDGVIAYATHGNLSWRLWWVKETDVADLDEDGGGPASGGRDGDQDYYMARVELDFGSFQASPAFGYLRNRQTTDDPRFATGTPSQDNFASCHNFRSADQGAGFDEAGNSGTCAANVAGVTVDETVVYPGLIFRGEFGPVSLLGEVFGAFGEIGDSSAVDAQREQDVAAYLVSAEVGVKLGSWLPHVGFVYMSGDDNPHDGDAEAWAGISPKSEEFFGERGIVIDDPFEALNINEDGLEATGNEPVVRQYFTQPGIIALVVGLKGKPTKKVSTDLNLIYLQWDKEKQWEYVDGMVSTNNCIPNKTLSQQGVCSNANFTIGVADGTGLVSSVDDEVGWELNGAVTYEYNQHVMLTLSAAVFWPGDGATAVAQCANAAAETGDYGWLVGGDAQDGCGAASGGGAQITTLSGISRADDEAFNVEAELFVEF